MHFFVHILLNVDNADCLKDLNANELHASVHQELQNVMEEDINKDRVPECNAFLLVKQMEILKKAI